MYEKRGGGKESGRKWRRRAGAGRTGPCGGGERNGNNEAPVFAIPIFNEHAQPCSRKRSAAVHANFVPAFEFAAPEQLPGVMAFCSLAFLPATVMSPSRHHSSPPASVPSHSPLRSHLSMPHLSVGRGQAPVRITAHRLCVCNLDPRAPPPSRARAEHLVHLLCERTHAKNTCTKTTTPSTSPDEPHRRSSHPGHAICLPSSRYRRDHS